MNKQTVIEYFGSITAVAKALGINPAAVSQWKDEIPIRRQYEIEKITGGKLKAAPLENSAA